MYLSVTQFVVGTQDVEEHTTSSAQTKAVTVKDWLLIFSGQLAMNNSIYRARESEAFLNLIDYNIRPF